MHNTLPVFWHPSSNADLRKYRLYVKEQHPWSRKKFRSQGIRKTISLQNQKQAKVPDLRPAIFSCEKIQFLCTEPSFRNDMLSSQPFSTFLFIFHFLLQSPNLNIHKLSKTGQVVIVICLTAVPCLFYKQCQVFELQLQDRIILQVKFTLPMSTCNLCDIT